MGELTLGQRIKAARVYNGITLVELAEKTGATHGYLSNLENNKRKPSIETLKIIAEVLEDSSLANLEHLVSENSTEEKSITVGQRIKVARKVAGLTLNRLAEISGFSNPYLSQIETGYCKKPSIEVLKALSDALGNVSFQELLMLAGYSDILPVEAFTQAPSIVDLQDMCKARTMEISENEIRYNGHALTTGEISRVLQVMDAMFPEYRERG